MTPLVHGVEVPPSRVQANVDPASVAVNRKVADVELTVPLGPDVIVVSGGVVSGPLVSGRSAICQPAQARDAENNHVRDPVAPAGTCRASSYSCPHLGHVGGAGDGNAGACRVDPHAPGQHRVG